MAGILEIKRGVSSVPSLNDGEFYLNKGINAVQIGSGSAILTLLPLNQIVSGDIILNGNIYANNLNISSSYALTSSYSYYALTASYIISSSTSQHANTADTASYVLSSNVYGPWGFNSIITSSYAVTASYAPAYLLTNVTQSMLAPYLLISNTGSMLNPYLLISQTSSFLTSADLSNYVTNSQTSSFVTNSQTSSFITNSQTSSFVTTSQTSSFIVSSQTGSMLAPYLPNSQTSSFVTNSQTSSFVTNSQTSSMTVATASYVSSSNVYGPNGYNSILTASYAQTASWAVGIIGGASTVSSSYPFDVTGSTIYSFNSKNFAGNTANIPTEENIIIGESAGFDSTISSSIVLGYLTAIGISASRDVIAMGEAAGQYSLRITGSTFIGHYAGQSSNASFSNFIGYNSGINAYNASNSNFVGYNSGRNATSASYSTLIGYQTGYRTGSGVVGIGSNNIIIGTNITLDDRRADSINIGGIIFGTGSYSTITGRPYSGSAAGRIGINVPIPLYNLHVSGTVAFPSLQQSSSAYIVMYDSGSGQLFYTASSAISGSGGGGASLTGGQQNYLAVWNSNTTLTTGSLYQTGSYIGINTTTPRFALEVSGSAQITNYVKIGDIPFPTWTTTTGSKFDAIDYIKDPTTSPQESMGRWTRSMYGSSSFTDFSNNRFEIVNFGRNLELAPGQTYNIASTSWNARKQAVGAGLGIGVSGSGTTPRTIYNSGYTLPGTNYAILGKVDFWPEFDAGTLPRDMNGRYSVFGGHYDIWAGSGSTAGNLNFYTAGGFKSMVSYSVDNVINYYSTLETESFESSRINNIYGFYSAPLYRSYATQSYGFYQSGSNDINFFEGRVGIGNGITNPSGSLHVSGNIYFSNLETSSVSNVLLYDSSSGQLFYTASSAIGGASLTGGVDGYVSLWTGSTTLTTSSIYQSGSSIGINTTNPSASLHVQGNFYQNGDTYIPNSPIVNVNNLYDWNGTSDVWSPVLGNPITLNGSIISSTTSSLVFAFDVTDAGYGPGTFPLPHIWTNLQLADTITFSYVPLSGPYYNNIESISWYSQSYDGTNYTVFYSSSISPGTVLPNTIYTIGVNHGSFIASSSVYFPNLENTSNSNVVLFDTTNGKLTYASTSSLKIPPFPYSGSAVITGSLLVSSSLQNQLILIGSGSTQPIFSVYGSQGELFTITDSLSGSLFSVHDISGLPVIESFSDATTLIGNYEAPALYTSIKKSIVSGVGQVVYQVPTASYDGIFYDYTVVSGSNARSGQVIARHLSGSVNFAEIATPDFGDTSDFELGVIVTGSYMALTGSATTNGWILKTIVRSI